MRDRSLDKQMEAVMALVLRGGVLLASVFVVVGAGLYVAGHAGAVTDYRDFVARGIVWQGFIARVLHLEAVTLMQLGILILVGTPVARVLLGAVVFLVEQDRLYVFVSVFILGILAYGILWG